MRKLVLGVPAQASGKNLTRIINAFGAPDTLRTCHLATPSQARRWPSNGWTAFRMRLHWSTPPGDYQPSHSAPWLAAAGESIASIEPGYFVILKALVVTDQTS